MVGSSRRQLSDIFRLCVWVVLIVGDDATFLELTAARVNDGTLNSSPPPAAYPGSLPILIPNREYGTVAQRNAAGASVGLCTDKS
jgi:hypothetical protein